MEGSREARRRMLIMQCGRGREEGRRRKRCFKLEQWRWRGQGSDQQCLVFVEVAMERWTMQHPLLLSSISTPRDSRDMIVAVDTGVAVEDGWLE